jgi:hypothetical protein
MSRYRTVQCLIWNDDKFPFATDDCKLVWFHLKTTPFSTPLGIFKAPVQGLAAEIHWPLKRYGEALKEGIEKGFWNVDGRFHVVYFPNFFKYNKPENPNVLKGWLKSWDEIPECGLKNDCYQQLMSSCQEWGGAFLNVFETLPKRLANVPETVTVTVTGTVTGVPHAQTFPKNGGDSNHFIEIWNAYPAHRRESENIAFDAWAHLNPNLALQKKIMKAIMTLKESEHWLEEKGKYVVGFTKFLKSKGWEAADIVEEIPPDRAGSDPRPPKGMRWKRDEEGELIHPLEAEVDE